MQDDILCFVLVSVSSYLLWDRNDSFRVYSPLGPDETLYKSCYKFMRGKRGRAEIRYPRTVLVLRDIVRNTLSHSSRQSYKCTHYILIRYTITAEWLMGRVMNDIILFKNLKLRFSISKTIYLHIVYATHIAVWTFWYHFEFGTSKDGAATYFKRGLLLFCTTYGKWFMNYETKFANVCKLYLQNEYIIFKWIDRYKGSRENFLHVIVCSIAAAAF